jgi:type II secretory pathway pseudopilin PulG
VCAARSSGAGFTLIEVVVALLVLEVAVVGAVGTLVLASTALRRAEALERAVATTEGVLDSIARTRTVGTDSVSYGEGYVHWTMDDSGRATLRALDGRGDVLFELRAVVGAP